MTNIVLDIWQTSWVKNLKNYIFRTFAEMSQKLRKSPQILQQFLGYEEI
jgi:hypothetical protein